MKNLAIDKPQIITKNPQDILTLEFDFEPDDQIFLNGYQSWTDSVEQGIHDKMRGLHGVPGFLVKKYAFDSYGDYRFVKYPNKEGMLHGFTYGYIRRDDWYYFVGSLGEENGFTKIEVDTKKGKITVSKEKDTLTAYEIFVMAGREEDVFNQYFESMGLPYKPRKKLTGYTTWYDRYENIDEELVSSQLSMYHANPKWQPDVFQIDDGYEEAVGDWFYVDKVKFPMGMKNVADKIKAQGMIPGIWLAPFSCKVGSRIEREHPEWIIKDDSGKKLLCGNNWGGFYGLDMEQDEVKQYVKSVLDLATKEWGFTFLKLDFLYSVCIQPRGGKSRGQLMCEAMDFIRENTKGITLLGCGVPLGAAFGKVDYCRIGCDVSLAYDDVWWMRRFHRERASTKNSIANTFYRRQLDGRAFGNDPDVYILRERNTKMTREQRKYLYEMNKKYGSVLFTSDNPAEYENIIL